jgi:hypothetical protein
MSGRRIPDAERIAAAKTGMIRKCGFRFSDIV